MHSALKILRSKHFLKQRARQTGTSLHVRAHVLEHLPFPAEILHELAGQFDRVPLDAINSRYAQHFDFGEQMMQAMAEFVEQRDHFVMSERGRFSAQWRGEIAIEIGNRRLYSGKSGLVCRM